LLNLSTKKAVSHQQFAPAFKTSTLNTNPNSPFRIGQALQHPKFGLGTVVKMEGGLDDLRLYINFAEHGLKWLDARYAKLSPA
jgi:DNA helicase-2/ATP-dependent DNA helicase PcrA